MPDVRAHAQKGTGMSSTTGNGTRLFAIVVAAIAVVALLALGSRSFLGREVHALVDVPSAAPGAPDALAALEQQDTLLEPGNIEPADRERVADASANEPAPATV